MYSLHNPNRTSTAQESLEPIECRGCEELKRSSLVYHGAFKLPMCTNYWDLNPKSQENNFRDFAEVLCEFKYLFCSTSGRGIKLATGPRFPSDRPRTRFGGSKLAEDCGAASLYGALLPTLRTSRKVGTLIAIPHGTYGYDPPECNECERMYNRGGECCCVRRIVCKTNCVTWKTYTRKDHLLFETLKMEVCQLVHVLREQGSNTRPQEDESTRVQ